MAGSLQPGDLLLAHGMTHVWAHSQAVAGAIRAIAAQHHLDFPSCETAALCHDLGGIHPADEMLCMARANGWVIDPAEQAYPFLLHQRFSRLIAEKKLDIQDVHILDAIACHTTLRAHATMIDMALYIADKIAWDQPGIPPYRSEVEAALAQSLPLACLTHIEYCFAHGTLLMPHQQLLEARQWLQNLLHT